MFFPPPFLSASFYLFVHCSFSAEPTEHTTFVPFFSLFLILVNPMGGKPCRKLKIFFSGILKCHLKEKKTKKNKKTRFEEWSESEWDVWSIQSPRDFWVKPCCVCIEDPSSCKKKKVKKKNVTSPVPLLPLRRLFTRLSPPRPSFLSSYGIKWISSAPRFCLFPSADVKMEKNKTIPTRFWTVVPLSKPWAEPCYSQNHQMP